MSKLSVIIFSLLFVSMFSRAEGDSLLRENISMELQVRQKSGTERLLTEYLSTLPTSTDTVYAIIYQPSQCPRCEASINNNYHALKKVRPDATAVLITVFSDSARAAAYNREKGYKADCYLYDTTNSYQQIFSFNTNAMIGTYNLKICRSKGELLFGAETFFMGSDEFFRELAAWNKRLPTEDRDIDSADLSHSAAPRPQCEQITNASADHTLYCGDQLLSEVYDVPKFDGDWFYFNDKLANAIMLFKSDGGTLRFRSKIEADSTERDRFIEGGPDMKRLFGEDNIFYIPLTSALTDSGHIGVSYSLPHIMTDTMSAGGGLAYFNQPVLIVRDLDSPEKPLDMIAPDFNIWGDTMFFYTHFKFCRFKDEIVYACQKLTWPMEYEREEYENVPARNPFCPGFYHSGNPWLATFSLATGRLTGRYGELEPCARISRTGYAYVSPLMRTCGNELVYTDRYSGTIHITDNLQDNDNAVYSAFSVDTAKFPQPDTAKFYTAEYSNEYDKFFYRCITDVQIDDSNVYCIVKYSSGGIYSSSPDDNDFTLVTIDRSTGMATERLLPHADGWQTMGFGLRTSSGRVTPFGFYRRADGGYVVREWTGCN